ncbi:MAG: amidohydrolase family protein [Clostridiaceae bacterium]|nr:amidohydrolase family protein [Clostridiaceae bacterium]
MKITDINTMIGPWPSCSIMFTEYEDLLKEMDNYRISTAVAFSSLALSNPMEGNKHIKSISDKSAGRIKPCYILDSNLDSSEMPPAEVLFEELKKDRPGAVKLYPKRNNFILDSFYCGELLDILDQLAMPVIFDSDEVPPFAELPKLAKQYPNIKFIILRHGFRESRILIPLIKKLNNVYFDTSIIIDTGLIEEIVSKYGSDKLLYGSGMPFYVPAGSLALILYARIPDSEKEKIFHGNWENLQEGIKYDK